MKTSAQREAEFRADLAALLEKHGAEMRVTDDGRAYGMHAGVCTISMDGEWDHNGDLTAEFTEFYL